MIKYALQYILEIKSTQIKSNVGFRGEGKTEVPGEKPLGAEKRTNKLGPHMMLSPGIEPGPHWWEASALQLHQPCSPIIILLLHCLSVVQTLICGITGRHKYQKLQCYMYLHAASLTRRFHMLHSAYLFCNLIYRLFFCPSWHSYVHHKISQGIIMYLVLNLGETELVSKCRKKTTA